MRKVTSLIAVLSAAVLFATSIQLKSQVPEQYYNSIIGDQIDVDSSFVVKDDKWGTAAWDVIDTVLEARDLVIFELNDDTTYIEQNPFYCEITVLIQSIDSTSNDTTSIIKTLSVSYDPGAVTQYKTRDVYAFKDGYKVGVQIQAINFVQTGWTGPLPPVFRLAGQIMITRKNEFDCNDVSNISSMLESTYGTVKFNWSSIIGAEEYDLEWTFYGNNSHVIQRYLDNPTTEFDNFDSLFYHNASRVTLNDNSYRIPNVFDSGYVFYRVRAVQYDEINDHRVEGAWSNSNIIDTTFSNYGDKQQVDEHEPTLNWQYQIQFAEEGKKIPSITYMDGTLRARQSVVRSEAVEKTIISETFYDHQGRPAVQTLPAPDSTNFAKIKYYDGFNTRNDTVYNRIFFDTSGCAFEPWPMDTTSGAGKYYSSENNDVSKAIHRFIPKSKGYHFTVTEYTPDLTGRISKQSSVGKELRMGSGRETKYFYVAPVAEEIDRLFGNEVGFTEHYFKNMVIDPNGGISISYLDASGHVIATCLAGDSPDNLSDLASNSDPDTLNVDLLISNKPFDGKIVQSFPFVPELSGDYTFYYSYTPFDYDPTCLDASICFDCLYDLNIVVTDMCGEIDSVVDMKNYTLGEVYDTLCANPAMDFDTTFTKELMAGFEYHITKTISVSSAGKDQYTEAYINNNTCIHDFEYFLNQAWNELDTTGCNITCESCLADLGTQEEYIDDYITSIETGGYTATASDTTDAENYYAEALASCEELCDTVIADCDGLYASILNDVSPGGQYALYSVIDGIYTAADTSILDVSDADTFFGNSYANAGTYYDFDGDPDTIWIGGYPVLPQNLPLEDFILNFKSSWAPTLADLHPEWCFYEFCSTHSELYEYANDMLTTSTFAEALTKGFLNPLGEDPASSGTYSGTTEVEYDDPGPTLTDPLFRPDSIGYSYWSEVQDSLHSIGTETSDTTIWMLSSYMIHCTDGGCASIPSMDSLCNANADMAWIIYRGIYLSIRAGILEEIITGEGCDHDEFIIGGDFVGKVQRVYFPSDALLLETDTTAIIDDVDDLCLSNCEAQADSWLALLDACLTDNVDTVNNVRDGLFEVCVLGCDIYHPFGSSTTPPDTMTADGYQSFADVLYGEANIDPADTTCGAYLIAFPDPYDSPSNMAQLSFSGKNDTCVCQNISVFHTAYTGSTFSGTFSEYMSEFYHTEISDETLEQIMDVCDGTCDWVNPPIALPSLFDCNGCIDCKLFVAPYTEFLNIIDNDTTFDDYEVYLTNFMNDYLGYNLTFTDYQSMIDTCSYTDSYNNSTHKYEVTYTGAGTALDSVFLCNEPVFPILNIDTTDCMDYLYSIANANALNLYNAYIDSVQNAFWAQYTSECINKLDEMFTMDKIFKQYHYTLYYYDQAGNLIKTVPPEGVHPLTDPGDLDDVKDYRNEEIGATATYPTHSLITRYHYNTLNQLIKQESPDGGETYFWYDRLGRIVASQNEKQVPNDQYSYTLYDALGRPYEAGQVENATTMTFAIALDNGDLSDWIGGGSNKQEVVRTFYDDIALPVSTPFGEAGQENLRNRIASITWEFEDDADGTTYDFATHYSYDIAGNVKVLVQELGTLRKFDREFKRIDYDFDLISGKVNKVWYQKDSLDQYAHWYVYDEDNKLTTVYTSHDGLLWDLDANYMYYDHGPLARVELGRLQVQGLDYAYTLQGWLKGMNADAFNPNKDMGLDGKTSGAHQYIGRDAVGFSLSYFTGDYQPIGSSNFVAGYSTTAGFGASSASLYNGNIRRATYAISNLTDSTIGYSYGYDQLNRLISMRAWRNFSAGSYAWPGSGSASTKWREDVTYDGNGNILSYIRNGNNSPMDSLNYYYYSNKNQLRQVTDAVSGGAYTVDIDDQVETYNYAYDSLGNLVKDLSEEIDSIYWTLTGKVDSIERTSTSTKDELKFYYDPLGNRVGKIVYPDEGDVTKTWYIRDAQGNIMATYTERNDSLWWSEQDIYGSSRLGVVYPDSLVYPFDYTMPGDTFTFFMLAGNHRYEITNHLGNVLSTITDRKMPQEGTTVDGLADYYLADIAASQDYYPFGMVMPGRSYQAGSTDGYRFGFNGKESDSETYGDGNEYDYGFRIYNPSIGRFLSIDAFSWHFQMLTPYQFSNNMPICCTDFDGLEATLAIAGNGGPGSLYATYPKDAKYFLAKASKLETDYGFSAVQVTTGKEFLNSLETATTLEGDIQSVIIFSHGTDAGLTLSWNEGFYIDLNPFTLTQNAATVSDLKAKMDNGSIKFTSTATILFASCNAASYDAENRNIAEDITITTGVSTIASTSTVEPEIIDGKETGRIKATTGTFIKNDLVFDVKYMDNNTLKTKTYTNKYEAEIYGEVLKNQYGIESTIETRLVSTDLGSTIDPIEAY